MKKVLIWLLIVFGLLIAIGYSYRRSLAFVKSRRTPAINQVSPEVSHQPVETGQAGTKPFTFLAGTAEMISYYNQQASDQDYIYFFENSLLRNRQAQIEDYKKVAKGKIIQSFASYQNAEAELPYIKDYIQGVGYDLEKWDKSMNEGENIEASSQKMQALAKKYHLLYFSHLGIQLAERNRVDPESIEHMAKYADGYNLSLYPCLEQKSMTECVSMARNMAVRAKKYNSGVLVFVGISLEKNISLEDQLEFLEISSQFADGFGVFFYPTRPGSAVKFRQVMQMLRG